MESEKEKVYMFYLIKKSTINNLKEKGLLDSLTSSISDGDNYYFYAYTNSKKLAKRFKRTRNEKEFFCKEVIMDDDEFEDFDGKYYSFNRLRYELIQFGKTTAIKVPITTGEYWYCTESISETIESTLSKLKPSPPPIGIFTKQMIALLSAMDYYRYIQLPTTVQDIDYIDHMDEEYGNVREYMNQNGWKNEFGLFLYLYNDILNPVNLLDGVLE